ncbi:uncharacterized protein LOC129748586 [Uranotaenia lowii]|uniref:uncharacterized protein LOC129748586 n=1 Tax=Uranotaenia lowii TaxID=190385 RepID=UPI002479AB31|nr:uncharacterized protein LOC129748586 [Uranotaenia lowii]
MKFVLYSGLCLVFASVTLAAVSKPQVAQLEATFKAFESCGFKLSTALDSNEKLIQKLAGPKGAKLFAEISETIVVLNETIYGAWDQLVAVATDAQAIAIGTNVKTISDATCKLYTDAAAAIKAKSLANFKSAVALYVKSSSLASRTLINVLNGMKNVDAKNVSDEVLELVNIASKLKNALGV